MVLHRNQGLEALIRRLARASGKIKKLSFRALAVGRLHGVQGTVIYAGKAGHLTIAALPDTTHRQVVIVEIVVQSGATAADVRQSTAALASLRPTGTTRRHR